MLFAVFAHAQDISDYNVVWNSQSHNSSESMPLGGGGIGCNVWVENNDIIFYIARSGTFDENNSMLKLGTVRLSLSPNPEMPACGTCWARCGGIPRSSRSSLIP